MKLGAFSVSLAVKDLAVSEAFYEKLGFKQFGGVFEQNWLIMKNDQHIIGLFQGMFDKNMLTFNPGWSQNAKGLAEFTDVRELQKSLKDDDIEVMNPTDESGQGPGSFMVVDPDGNPILIDQHC
jgi:lactoylglutathione lyase